MENNKSAGLTAKVRAWVAGIGVLTVLGLFVAGILFWGGFNTAMELTNAGIVDDAAKAQALMQVLLDNATYESASVGGSETRSLLIALDNGLLIQLMVGDDTLSACGTWSCPELCEAFTTAVAE